MKFLGYDRLVLFAFDEFLLWAENWMLSAQKHFTQKNINEEFPFDNLGLAKLLHINIF